MCFNIAPVTRLLLEFVLGVVGSVGSVGSFNRIFDKL